MNNDEKKQNLNYDFDFENQVVKEKNEMIEDVEILNDSDIDEFEELEEIEESEINSENVANDNLNVQVNTQIDEENKEEVKEENVKKIKILNKEFNFEDIVLVLIGLIIVVAIFLLPRIIK